VAINFANPPQKNYSGGNPTRTDPHSHTKLGPDLWSARQLILFSSHDVLNSKLQIHPRKEQTSVVRRSSRATHEE